MINLRLIALSLGLLCGFYLSLSNAYAQDVKAMPVQEVIEEAIPVLNGGPLVVELFSSQACVFCPDADRLFAELIKQDNVIGLACHVDYFDVSKGSLSQSFCTDRQDFYMEALAAGPNYTPQIVINGETDVVGYKYNDVIEELKKSVLTEVFPIDMAETDAAGTYKVVLPMDKLPENGVYKLWLAVYDKPHNVTIAEGRNKGTKASYYHIVSALGSTEELGPEVFVTPPLDKKKHGGFAVLLQDMNTGRIYAAAEHRV